VIGSEIEGLSAPSTPGKGGVFPLNSPRKRRCEENMNASCYTIAITLFSSMGQGQTHYTKTSIKTLIENLEKYHQIKIHRRWTFQCLKNMLESGYITRRSRYKQGDGGIISQIPSLYAFTVKGIKLLARRRVTGAAKLLKTMMNYISGRDQRWPKAKDVAAPVPFKKYTPSRADWTKLFGIVGKKIE